MRAKGFTQKQIYDGVLVRAKNHIFGMCHDVPEGTVGLLECVAGGKSKVSFESGTNDLVFPLACHWRDIELVK